jgi:hypothetical protein
MEKPLKFYLKFKFPFEDQFSYLYLTSKKYFKGIPKRAIVDPK